VKPVHVIFGKCIPGVLIGLVEIGLFFVIALFWFGIPFRGSLWTFLFFAIVYMMSSLGVGIFISTVARTLQQVLFLTFFAFIFFILLSGFFIPVENMPHWVQVITCLNPVRFFMAAVRAIFLKGATLSQLWREAVFLIVIGTSIFALSFLFFRRKVS
jgi:ABC-2 type transport system permease protein